MGKSESKPAPAPAPHPPPPPPPPPPPKDEFDKPWREMHWGTEHDLKQKLRDFKVQHPEVRFVRILLVGDVGVGKSSFINSINNVFQKRITCNALTANANTESSCTKQYKTYYIEGNDGNHLSFAFNDIMGLEQNCCHTNDIIKALRGFLKEGFNFDKPPLESAANLEYKISPSLQDQVYCLVNIMAADKVSLMHEGVITKMRRIHEAASQLNMPQVIVMSRPDLACPLVQKNIKNIYTSKKIKEKMEICGNKLGITMSHIFPVKNYHQEIDTNKDVDLLILKALDQIVHLAVDALKAFRSAQSMDEGLSFNT